MSCIPEKDIWIEVCRMGGLVNGDFFPKTFTPIVDIPKISPNTSNTIGDTKTTSKNTNSPSTNEDPPIKSLYQNDYCSPLDDRGTIEEARKKYVDHGTACLFKCGRGKKEIQLAELQKKVRRISEYKDSISRIGCNIMKADIHNHSKCVRDKKAKTCTHFIDMS